MERAAGAVGLKVAATLNWTRIGPRRSAGIQVYDPWRRDLNDVPVGTVDARAGAAAAEAVIAATKLALDGHVAAIVTAPINKAAINAAGFHYAGHTELLADLTDSHLARACCWWRRVLRVIHNSTHVSLREAIERVTRENVRHVIGLLGRDAAEDGDSGSRESPFAGLNPHAGGRRSVWPRGRRVHSAGN